jgi:hypothetical protein
MTLRVMQARYPDLLRVDDDAEVATRESRLAQRALELVPLRPNREPTPKSPAQHASRRLRFGSFDGEV